MNFCYIFTIFCAIIILALIFVSSIEAFVGGNADSKTKNEQLNIFRKTINEAKQDLNTIGKPNGQIDGNLLRQRRQTIDEMLNNFQMDRDIENENWGDDADDYNRDNDEEVNGLRQLRAKEYRGEHFNKHEIPKEDTRGVESWNHDHFKSNPPLSQYKSLKIFLDHENSENDNKNDELACSAGDMRCHEGNSEEGDGKGNKEYGKIHKPEHSGRDHEESNSSVDIKGFTKDFPKKIPGKNRNQYVDHKSSNKEYSQNEVNSNINQNNHQQNIQSDRSSLNSCGFLRNTLNNGRCSSKSNGFVKTNNRDLNSYYRDSSKPLNEEKLNYFAQHPMNFDLDTSTESAVKAKNLKDTEEEDELYNLKYPGTNSTSSSTENLNSLYNIHFDNLPESNDQTLDKSRSYLDTSKIYSQYNDQFENTKNNLSHEADYKLSKMEQDASEKKKDFTWKLNNFKRSAQFNPMNEIKLKTSSRLMKKGYGASLPSYSLGETRKELMIENMLKRKEQKLFKNDIKYYFDNSKLLDEKFNEEVPDRDKLLEDFENEPLNPVLMPVETKNWNYMRRKRIIDNLKAKCEDKEKTTKTKKSNKEEKQVVKNEEQNKNIEEYNKNKCRMSHKEPSSNHLEESIKALSSEEDNMAAKTEEDSRLENFKVNGFKKALKAYENSKDESKYHPAKIQANLIPKCKLTRGNINFYKKPLQIETDQVQIDNKNLHRRRKRSLDQKESRKNIDEFKSNYIKPLKILKRVKRLHPIKALNLKIYQRFHSPQALKLNKLKRLQNTKFNNKKSSQRQTHDKRNQYKSLWKGKSEKREIFNKTLNEREKFKNERKKIEVIKKRANEEKIINFAYEEKTLENIKNLQKSLKKSRRKREIVSNNRYFFKAINNSDIFASFQEKNITESENIYNFLPHFIKKLWRNTLGILKSVKAFVKSLMIQTKLAKLKNNMTNTLIKNHIQKNIFNENLKENINLVKSSTIKQHNSENPLEINSLKQKFQLNTGSDLYFGNDLPKNFSFNKSFQKNYNEFKKLKELNKNFKSFVIQEIPKNREKRSKIDQDILAQKLSFDKSSMKENHQVTNIFKVLQQQTPIVAKNIYADNYVGKDSNKINLKYREEKSSNSTLKQNLIIEKLNMVHKLRYNISSSKEDEIINNNIKDLLQEIIFKEYMLFLKSLLTKAIKKEHLKNNEIKFENTLKSVKNPNDVSNSHFHKLLFKNSLEKSTNKKNFKSFKNRQKRSNKDFDNFQVSEDELLSKFKRSSRVRRSVNSKQKENILKSNLTKHRIKKRYVNNFQNLYQPKYDFNSMSNSLPQNFPNEDILDSNVDFNFCTANQDQEKNKLDFSNLKRNENSPIYDYENIPRALYEEPFYNLKLNKPIQKSAQFKYNSYNLKAPYKSFLNSAKLNLKDNARWRKSVNKRQHIKSEVKPDSNFKINISKQKLNHKSQEIPTSKSVETFKKHYFNDLQNFNQNYNPNPRNWFNSLDDNNISVEDFTSESTKPKDENQTITSNNSTKISLALRNEILNCTAFTTLQDFLNSLPKNITDGILGINTKPPHAEIQTTDKIDIEFSTPDLNELSTNSTTTTTTCISPTVLPTTDVMSTEAIYTTLESFTEPPDLDESTPIEYPDITEANPELSTESEWSKEEVSVKSTTEFLSTESILESLSTEYITFPTDSEDNVKLNVTINANVHANPKAKNFFGNGTIKIMPGFSDDRIRREILLPPFEELQNRRCAHKPIVRPNVIPEDHEGINSLASGKLSANVVKSIFKTVQENPKLQELWPSLRHNQSKEIPVLQNLYALRNQDNEQAIQQTENLLQKAMESINDIIEEQVRTHACVPLRPDLQEFYDLILQTRKEQEKCGHIRDTAKALNLKDFSEELRLMDPNEIKKESRIVKKLLKQYEELPEEDQQQVAMVKQDLLKNLFALSNLKDIEERQASFFNEKKEFDLDESDAEVMKRLEKQYTPQFLKLLKAAELYREITSESEEPIL